MSSLLSNRFRSLPQSCCFIGVKTVEQLMKKRSLDAKEKGHLLAIILSTPSIQSINAEKCAQKYEQKKNDWRDELSVY